MKTRSGFVSNSSSSSFIVGFKTIPKDVEEMQRLLFGTLKKTKDGWDNRMNTKSLAKKVFKDNKNNELDLIDIIIEMNELLIGSYPERANPFNSPTTIRGSSADFYKYNYDAGFNAEQRYIPVDIFVRDRENKVQIDKSTEEYKKMLKAFPDLSLEFRTFTYADDNGDNKEAYLKTGEAFKHLPHYATYG